MADQQTVGNRDKAAAEAQLAGTRSPIDTIAVTSALQRVENAAIQRNQVAAGEIVSLRQPTVLAALQPALALGDVQPPSLTPLQSLLNRPPTYTSQATVRLDGRTARLVLVTVQDRFGQTRAGIPVQLFDNASTPALIDSSTTDRTGFALLKLPMPSMTGTPAAGATGMVDSLPQVNGSIKVLDGSPSGFTATYTIPGGVQFTKVLAQLPTLPPIPGVSDGSTMPVSGTPTTMPVTVPTTPVVDDPLARLPGNFSVELCHAIEDHRSRVPDPILGNVAGMAPDDFRGHRTPMVRRITVPRIGPVGDVQQRGADTAVPRYVVRMRQTWVFLGYTLGEIARVESLDPGEVIDEATQTVQRTITQVSRIVDDVVNQTRSTLSDILTSRSSVDAVASLQTNVETMAAAGGFFLGIPGIGGIGGAGGVSSVSANTLAQSSVDTSLDVAHLLNTATSVVNTALRSATSDLLDQARTLTQSIGKVSPLLSRVTNLMRWNLYENYAVCTEVEDVHEVRVFDMFQSPRSALPTGGLQSLPYTIHGFQGIPDITVPQVTGMTPAFDPPTFTDEDIVDLRPFFQPRLLEQRLTGHFDVLAQAIEENNNGGRPVTSVELEVGYTTQIAGGALTVSLAGIDTVVPLVSGGTSARATLRLPYPMRTTDLQHITFTLTLSPIEGFIGDIIDHTSLVDVRVNSIRLWAGRPFAQAPDFSRGPSDLGMDQLHVNGISTTSPVDFAMSIAPLTVDTSRDALFRHINRNRTYYLGVLAEAALRYPSLRDDTTQIAAVYPGSSKFWELPILGFEGDRVLVLTDVSKDDSFAQNLLQDPGTATIVQILAPGAYSEALQGLLSLTDAQGLLHPKLAQPTELLMSPFAPVDITGKKLDVVETLPVGNGATLPTGNGTPVGTGTGTGVLPH